MLSCTSIIEEDITQYEEMEKDYEESIATRSIDSDTLDLGELVCLEQTPEMERLKFLYDEVKSRDSLSSRIVGTPGSNVDEFFSSNIYAIRELPINIKVRSIASGESSSYCYLSCSGAAQEVTLGNSQYYNQSKFYLKIPPAIAGIPYLIYSNVSNTPLCVGHYTSNPDQKVLMSAEVDSGIPYTASWDLLPATTKGYFAVQSESYLGQSDPDNPYSVFCYVLEAKSGNKLGYSKRVSNKAQQEFKIEPVYSFTLETLEYKLNNAVVSSTAPAQTVVSRTNITDFEKSEDIDVILRGAETSVFQNIEGTLAVNVCNPNELKFQRPIPIAGLARLHEVIPDAEYISGVTRHFTRTVSRSTYINMPPRSYLELTARFQKFILRVPYVITAKYEDCEVKLNGIWTGSIIANPDYYPPTFEAHLYDLDTEAEITCSLEYDEVNDVYKINLEE